MRKIFIIFILTFLYGALAFSEVNYAKEDKAYNLHTEAVQEKNKSVARELYSELIDGYADTEYFNANMEAIKEEVAVLNNYLDIEDKAKKLLEETKNCMSTNKKIALNLLYELKEKYSGTDYYKNNYAIIEKYYSGLSEELEAEKKLTAETLMPDKELFNHALDATVVVEILQKNTTIGADDTPVCIFSGSGFIVSDKGTVITSAHVVADAKDIDFMGLGGLERTISVKLNDSTVMEATVIDRDNNLDIAILELKSSQVWSYKQKKPLAALELGDSDNIYAGQEVIIAGSPIILKQSVSKGVISHTEREFPELEGKYIQTDIAVYPGNSGSPLVTKDGKVVGVINYVLFEQAGLNLAIPINKIKRRFF